MHFYFSVTGMLIPWRKLLFLVFICNIFSFTIYAEAKTAELIYQNANNDSYLGDISGNGKYIVYVSSTSDLVLSDGNRLTDIFLYDVDRNKTERLSVALGGGDSNGRSSMPFISADGQFVAFTSEADNLVDGDQNGSVDIFVYNRTTETLDRISLFDKGDSGWMNRTPSQLDISGDGRYVVFDSTMGNLVDNESNNPSNIFLYDRVSDTTDKISNAIGANSDGDSGYAVISDNGQFIAFESKASNLVLNDTNERSDVFVYDKANGGITRISVNSIGEESYGDSLRPQISESGQFVSFYSNASNLVEDAYLRSSYIDTNDGVYLFDRASGSTELLTVSAGNAWPDQSINPVFSMSSNASYIVFSSKAHNLTEYWAGLCEDTSIVSCFWGEKENIFRYSRFSAHTELISVNDSGFPLGVNGIAPSISDDGKLVSFTSSDYDSERGISRRQINLSSSSDLLATYLIAPGEDLFEDYPDYIWATHNQAVAYRLSTADALIQPWLPVNEAECSIETCLTTPLTTLDYGVHSVFIQYATELGEISPLSEPMSVYKRPVTPYPEALTADISKPITLTWNEVSDAIDYRLKVKDKVTGDTIINYRIKDPGATSYTLPFTLNPEHSYQWKIKVQEPSGLYSSWVQITHQAAPGIPIPIFPEGEIDDLTPSFQWSKVENSLKQRIVIQDVDTLEIVTNKIIKYDLSYTHSEPFIHGHRYRWKVRAQSPDGEYSKWSYFELSDEDSSTAPQNSITLTWGVPEKRVDGSVLVEGNISHYVVVYQREQDAVEEIIIRDAALTTLAMSNLEDGHYQFKIRVIDNMGLASDFSEGVKIMLPRSTGF